MLQDSGSWSYQSNVWVKGMAVPPSNMHAIRKEGHWPLEFELCFLQEPLLSIFTFLTYMKIWNTNHVHRNLQGNPCTSQNFLQNPLHMMKTQLRRLSEDLYHIGRHTTSSSRMLNIVLYQFSVLRNLSPCIKQHYSAYAHSIVVFCSVVNTCIIGGRQTTSCRWVQGIGSIDPSIVRFSYTITLREWGKRSGCTV